jgi:hypothetical protein
MSESESKAASGKSEPVQQNSESQSSAPVEPPVKEMRSVVLTSYGGLKGIRVTNRPEPTVSDGEVAIRVKYW